jgi:hypothetical protein
MEETGYARSSERTTVMLTFFPQLPALLVRPLSRFARHNRLAHAAFAALTAATFMQTGTAAAAPVLPERVVTQEGLAIALASTVLQSQLQIVVSVVFQTKGCTVLQGGTGSIRILSHQKLSKNKFKALVGVYFDEKCKMPYVMANAILKGGGGPINVTETAVYTNPTGHTLGSLRLNETALLTDTFALTGVIGTGIFTPANGAVPVSLGLECQFPSKPPKTQEDLHCEGGIAQDFPALKESAGSVTPLHLVIPVDKDGNPQSVSFAGAKSIIATGALGGMSIVEGSQTALALQGKQKVYGSVVTSGAASQFSLFPPTPTGWTVVDAVHDTEFSIAVIDDTTRQSKGTVTQISTGAVIAQFIVDQSGTGTIRYNDGTKVPITSWLLAD